MPSPCLSTRKARGWCMKSVHRICLCLWRLIPLHMFTSFQLCRELPTVIRCIGINPSEQQIAQACDMVRCTHECILPRIICFKLKICYNLCSFLLVFIARRHCVLSLHGYPHTGLCVTSSMWWRRYERDLRKTGSWYRMTGLKRS